MTTNRFAVLIAVTVYLSLSATIASAAADVWDGNGASPPNGTWGTGDNWVDNSTPNNADTATLNLANTYNVTFNAAPAAIQALTTSAGNVTFASSGGAQALPVNSASGGQDVSVNGGATISLGASGNPLHLTIGDDLIVNGSGTLNINHGSQVTTLDLVLGMPVGPGGSGAIVVDGAGSTLNRIGSAFFSVGNNGAVLTFRNNSTGNIDGPMQLLAGGSSVNVNVNAESGAHLELDGLTIGNGAAASSTATVTTTGSGSTITQTGASALTIGRGTGGAGMLNVNSNAVFTTGTGAINLNATGRLNIGGGTLHANGPMTLDSGSILTLNGGTLNANAGLDNSTGGALNLRNGELNVNGGTFSGGFTLDGLTASDMPHLRFTSGATGTMAGQLTVAGGNHGKLTVEDGAHLSAANGTIGGGGGSNGEVIVRGAGSELRHQSGSLTVGNLGAGTLTIEDHGLVYVGTNLAINSTSAVNLNGGTLRFSTVTGSGGLSPANFHFNSGTIQLAGNQNPFTNGVSVELFGLPSGDVAIPNGKGLTIEGQVYVAGAELVVNGGKFSTPDVLNVGNGFSPGRLKIINGGTVVSGTGYVGSIDGPANQWGEVLVSGSGSSWTIDGVGLDVGSPNTTYPTTLTISDGAVVTADGLNIGNSGILRGSVTVKGLGSKLIVPNSGGYAYIGSEFSGSGMLTIEDQGTAFVEGLVLNSTGTIILNGGTLRIGLAEFDSSNFKGAFSFINGTIDLGGNQVIGVNTPVARLFGSPLIVPDKNLTIEGTATLLQTVVIDGGTFSVGQLQNAHLLHFQRGTLNITNQAVTIAAGGPLGDALDVHDDMTINVTSGITNQGLITGDGEIGGHFTNHAAGELRAQPGKSLKLTGLGNTNAGQIKLVGGELEFANDLTNNAGALISGNGSLFVGGGLTNNGTMNFAGTANITGHVANAAGGKIISGGGGATIFYGDVTNNGEIRTSTNSFTVFFGSVSGSGTFTGSGTVNFEGDVSPGSSPAAVNFAGDVTFGPDATVEIELGGTIAGTLHDKLNALGDLSLAGVLEINLINGFAPTAGQTFDVLDWGSLAGSFSTLRLPALAGLAWNTSQLYNTGVLSVVPAGLPGDFNQNGSVDAADYVVWRKTGGSLDNYNTWRANFGQTFFTGSGASAISSANPPSPAVPEPATLALLMFAAAGPCLQRRRAE